MEGEGCDHGKNRDASSFDGETELGDAESESSGGGVEMVTSEADDTEVESTPFVSGRAVSTTSRAGSSIHSEGLADAPVTSDNLSHGPDQWFAVVRAGEAKRLAEHIPGQLRATIFKGRTRVEERRSKNTAQTNLISEEDELDIACTSRRRIPWNKRCRWTLRRLSRCRPGRCKTSRHRQRRRRKCADHQG